MRLSVPKVWEGDVCVILAGGPSLNAAQVGIAAGRGTRIIAINDSWRLVPWGYAATNTHNTHWIMRASLLPRCALYFGDERWWRGQIDRNPRSIQGFTFHDLIYKGWWWTGSPDFAEHPQVNSLRLTGQRGLEACPTGLRHGSNSGYAAINLAVHLGCRKIVLLGYDMRVVEGRTHWHDEPRPGGFADVLAQTMVPHFEYLVEPLRELGVTVINATPDSALTCFPNMTLEEALADPADDMLMMPSSPVDQFKDV